MWTSFEKRYGECVLGVYYSWDKELLLELSWTFIILYYSNWFDNCHRLGYARLCLCSGNTSDGMCKEFRWNLTLTEENVLETNKRGQHLTLLNGVLFYYFSLDEYIENYSADGTGSYPYAYVSGLLEAGSMSRHWGWSTDYSSWEPAEGSNSRKEESRRGSSSRKEN